MIQLDQGGRGLAWARVVAPPRALTPWIEHLWIQRYPTPVEGLDWLVVPDASAHILVRADADRRSVRVVGPRSTAVRFELGPRRWSVGVRLRPGALTSLVRGSSPELLDGSAPLEEYLDLRPLDRVLDRESPDPEQAMQALIRLLSIQLIDQPHPDWRVRALVQQSERSRSVGRVRDAAREMGVSQRGLRAVMQRWVGLSPKTLLRVQRVQRTAWGLLSGEGSSLARLAYRRGYSDHAHLTRDFQALMGESPTSFRRRAPADSFKPGADPGDTLCG